VRRLVPDRIRLAECSGRERGASSGSCAAIGLRVNDVTVGIGLFIFGTGLRLSSSRSCNRRRSASTLGLGEMSVPAIRAALDVSRSSSLAS
jgi:hypothetical protein